MEIFVKVSVAHGLTLLSLINVMQILRVEENSV